MSHPVVGFSFAARIANFVPFDIPSNAKLTLLHVMHVRNGKSWQTMSLMRMIGRCSGGFQENMCYMFAWQEKKQHEWGQTIRVQRLLCQTSIRTEYGMSEGAACDPCQGLCAVFLLRLCSL